MKRTFKIELAVEVDGHSNDAIEYIETELGWARQSFSQFKILHIEQIKRKEVSNGKVNW
jgi:hypothetical protein